MDEFMFQDTNNQNHTETKPNEHLNGGLDFNDDDEFKATSDPFKEMNGF